MGAKPTVRKNSRGQCTHDCTTNKCPNYHGRPAGSEGFDAIWGGGAALGGPRNAGRSAPRGLPVVISVRGRGNRLCCAATAHSYATMRGVGGGMGA